MTETEAKYQALAAEFAEQRFSPETNEQHEQLLRAARNILDCFDWDPAKEDFLLVTDTKVMHDNPIMIKALERELSEKISKTQQEKNKTGRFQTLVTEASPKSAAPLGEAVGEAMWDKPVLILTSMSRSHSRETGAALRGSPRIQKDSRLSDDAWEKLRNLAKSRRSRIISITKGHNPYDILTKGAVLETVENLRERADRVDELMRDVERVHITTQLGTDLWLRIHPELKEIEDGRVDKPGKLSNYPIGEWSCSPDWQGSSGTLVVDGPCGGNINQDILDKGEPLRLEIKNGEIVNSSGGKEALRLWRAYLDSGNNAQNHAYRLAELGIGTNSQALKGKPREYWGSSEGEKVYGTVHMAVGSNGSFGRELNDPNFNSATVHCDMVIGLNPGGAPTVECFRKNGSKFTLVENGKPVGY